MYFMITNSSLSCLIIDKTAEKKSKEDTEEKKKKRSRAKSISGYRRWCLNNLSILHVIYWINENKKLIFEEEVFTVKIKVILEILIVLPNILCMKGNVEQK